MEERRLPPVSRSRAALVLFALVIFVVIAVLYLRGAPFVLSVVLFGGLCVSATIYYRRRCSNCGGRLVFRKDPIPGGTTFRCLFDCQKCGIVWDRGDSGDESIT